MELSKLKINFFNWSLVLLFITLPMPKYSLSTQALIVLAISWLLLNSFKEKVRLLKEHSSSILLLSSLYGVMLVGMIYTENLDQGLEQLKDKLPFLIIPIIIGTTQTLTSDNKFKFIKIFSISVVLMALFALAKAWYIHALGMGDYFVYDKLSILLNKHTTYYSLYCVIAISYFLYDLLQLKKTNLLFSIVAIIILLFFIYLLSARIAIIALIVVAIYYIKMRITHRKQKVFLSLLVIGILSSTLLFSSNYTARFESISKNPNELTENNEFNTRLIHWKSALETLNTSSYIFGKGTGDGKENLYQQYLKNDFTIGYLQKYNAHNQYIEFLLSNGLLIIIAYFCLLLAALIYAIRFNDLFGVLVVLLFMMYSITESILERQSGVLIVALLCSVIHFSNKELLNKKNR
ncbi:O-antigen ligase family protein [Mesonia aquimarina]|uniref:O-antigen ligase family protein n=1 Tax=Mesonia aquimarina TaxID=1504967 RepID=UPI000EF6065C|nr:O-antigen ligase family protein [Mesonia aquimarina]